MPTHAEHDAVVGAKARLWSTVLVAPVTSSVPADAASTKRHTLFGASPDVVTYTVKPAVSVRDATPRQPSEPALPKRTAAPCTQPA